SRRKSSARTTASPGASRASGRRPRAARSRAFPAKESRRTSLRGDGVAYGVLRALARCDLDRGGPSAASGRDDTPKPFGGQPRLVGQNAAGLERFPAPALALGRRRPNGTARGTTFPGVWEGDSPQRHQGHKGKLLIIEFPLCPWCLCGESLLTSAPS